MLPWRHNLWSECKGVSMESAVGFAASRGFCRVITFQPSLPSCPPTKPHLKFHLYNCGQRFSVDILTKIWWHLCIFVKIFHICGIFRHASVSSTYPCQMSVGWSVRHTFGFPFCQRLRTITAETCVLWDIWSQWWGKMSQGCMEAWMLLENVYEGLNARKCVWRLKCLKCEWRRKCSKMCIKA